ncbi:meiotic recombination protein rec14 [Biscogniauxia mediterranea]|nr:meiotic recombination protein rec14 [Biscogniauxia mediterranea]
MATIQQLRMASAISSLLPRFSPLFPSISSLAIAIPAAISNIPSILGDIWEGILRAVPKSKTSHMKKRHRQMAGKALKDSKQYLTTHSVDQAHLTDIFSIAATPTSLISASGSSSLQIHSTTDSTFPLVQTLSNVHKLGCHHVVVSRDGKIAASAGFGGELKIWKQPEPGSNWEAFGEIDTTSKAGGKGAGEVWAIALSENGQFLASTTYDGRINVWDVFGDRTTKLREYETGSAGSGSFGLCVDLSRDGRFTASGHQNGAVYVFNNDTGRIQYSLPGLVKPVRAIAFSPASTRLAAAGDAATIAVYDTKHGEHVGNLTGHSAWVTSLDWSNTGEYLLSGAFDGKVKVWSIDRGACVATHSETDRALWTVRWLPKTTKNEMFCTAGANRSLTFYREATGA